MKLQIENVQTGETLESEGTEEELKDFIILHFPYLVPSQENVINTSVLCNTSTTYEVLPTPTEESPEEDSDSLIDLLEDLNQSQFISATLTEGESEIKPHHHQPEVSNSDSLSAVLNHTNPKERLLALKSSQITPYHLRAALYDEDAQVRQYAAQHPKMTDELIHEALKHPDSHTKHAVLDRPDITSHHLSHVLNDPEVHYKVLLHPALTPEQLTQKQTQYPQLEKNIGHLTYPNFGVPSIPTQAKIVSPEGFKDIARLKGAQEAPPKTEGRTLYPVKKAPLPEHRQTLSVSAVTGKGDKALNAASNHEEQHGVYARIKQTYGKEAGQRLVTKTLEALTPEESGELNKMYSGLRVKYAEDKRPEEMIAYMHQYLQDLVIRQTVHTNLNYNKDKAKALHSNIKVIWKKLQQHASKLKPEDVGLAPVKKATFEDKANDWIALAKADEGMEYNTSEEMLGVNSKFEALLDAAQFLAHSKPDLALFRQALLADKPPEEAALISVGLPTDDKTVKSLESVLQLQKPTPRSHLEKSESKRTVTNLMPDGEEVATAIQEGLRLGNIEDLQLKGKHSKGTKLVMSPEGKSYILKQGSGKQSPAAGANEEKANQARRECLFWHIANSWGLGGVIPRADLVLLDEIEVAAIEMLPLNWANMSKLAEKDINLPSQALEKYREIGDLHKWAVLDFIAGNSDRHMDNLMVSPARDGHQISLIDHGAALAGPSFNPSIDRNSFIPYYLRANSHDWANQSPEERLRFMSTVQGKTDDSLKSWVLGLDRESLESELVRYGFDPKATLDRLDRVKQLATKPNLSQAINKLWVSPKSL